MGEGTLAERITLITVKHVGGKQTRQNAHTAPPRQAAATTQQDHPREDREEEVRSGTCLYRCAWCHPATAR